MGCGNDPIEVGTGRPKEFPVRVHTFTDRAAGTIIPKLTIRDMRENKVFRGHLVTIDNIDTHHGLGISSDSPGAVLDLKESFTIFARREYYCATVFL